MDQKNPKTSENPQKKDFSEQLYTPFGSKKDNEKLMQNLLEELHISNEKYNEKSMKILIDREIKSRKASNSYQKASESQKDIPIDGDLVSGSRLFMQNCMSCHNLEMNNKGYKTTGPALGLIYGKKAGSDPYFDYSEGLLKANFAWSEKRLFDFMKEPKNMIKDVRCEVAIENKAERADLTKFLKKFTKELHKNLRVKANQLYGKDYVDSQINTRKSLHELELKRNKEKFNNEN